MAGSTPDELGRPGARKVSRRRRSRDGSEPVREEKRREEDDTGGGVRLCLRVREHQRAGTASGRLQAKSLNIPGAPYPCVYPDNRVMFRVVAPDAQKVRVRLGQGFDMTKAPDGMWYATTTPQVVGFHYYTLSIDGAVVADPATRTFFGSGFYNSAIEVPEPDADYYTPEGRAARRCASVWYSPR